MYSKITAEFEVEDEQEYLNLTDMISQYGGNIVKEEAGD